MAETKYRVIVNSDANPGGDKPITIVVNGRISQLNRDVEVLLTEAQLEVLKNAQVRGYTMSESGQAVTVPGKRRFSFSILGKETVSGETAASNDTDTDDATS